MEMQRPLENNSESSLVNKCYTFDEQLRGALLVSRSDRVGRVVVHGAVVNDHDSLSALVLKNIPKIEVN